MKNMQKSGVKLKVMATIFQKRLRDKYGKGELRTQRYNSMIKKILVHNNEKAGRAISRLSTTHYKDSLKKVSKEKAKTVKLPDLSEVLPKRSVFLIKGADDGEMIAETLRKQL